MEGGLNIMVRSKSLAPATNQPRVLQRAVRCLSYSGYVHHPTGSVV
jgi:hypothetical protein